MPTINQTIRKINSFAGLPIGWHYGDGEPPSTQIIEDAENFVRLANLFGLSEANAFPGVDGQIELTFYVNEYTYAFMFEINGTISIVKEKIGEIIWDEYEQSYAVALDKLWTISQENQTTSDSFILGIGTQKISDLGLHSSNDPQPSKTRKEVSRLYQLNVSKKVNEAFVNISDTFTAQSQPVPQSFCR